MALSAKSASRKKHDSSFYHVYYAAVASSAGSLKGVPAVSDSVSLRYLVKILSFITSGLLLMHGYKVL